MNTCVRKQILKISKCLWEKNLLAACDGNLSVRQDDSTVLITPSGKAKAYLSPEDLLEMSMSGHCSQGVASSEKVMHLSIYRNCPKATAVIHAHPPYAIAWSIAFPEDTHLPSECLPEVILACGGIPLVPYFTPGTPEAAKHLKSFLPEPRVMVLKNHGALTWGESLEEAHYGMERLEHSSQILYFAHNLAGKLSSLPQKEIEKLKALRKQIGQRIL